MSSQTVLIYALFGRGNIFLGQQNSFFNLFSIMHGDKKWFNVPVRDT